MSAAVEFSDFDGKCLSEFYGFKIRNPADLGFEFGKRVSADVPTKKVELGAKLRLRKTLLLSNLPYDRAYDVAQICHCSEFGTSKLTLTEVG